MHSHIEMRTADNISAGMSPEEARREAVLRFGSRAAMKERVIAADAHMFLDSLWQDLCYGLRMLRKSPGFTAVAVLTLALGIGANTAIFTFMDAIVLRPVPIHDAQRLVVFSWTAHAVPKYHGYTNWGDCQDCSFSVPLLDAMRAQASTFSGLAAFAGPEQLDLSGNGAPSIVSGEFISGDYFSTLGVKVFLGRPIELTDDSPNALVLSYFFWQRAFGGDRSAVGRTVRVNNVPFLIVGVADPAFTTLAPGELPADFFLPLAAIDKIQRNTSRPVVSDTTNWWVTITGRLKSGASLAQAQAAASTIFRNEALHGATPLSKEADAPAIILKPLWQGLSEGNQRITPLLALVLLLFGFILLIACANVAGLTLARSAARQREMAVRLSLGAGRARLVRQLLTESLTLSVAGGVLGVFVAVWLVNIIIALIVNASGQAFPFHMAPDWRVLLFSFVLTFLTAVACGLAPALRGTRVDLTPSLKESASLLLGGAARRSRFFRLSNALVIAQVALSLVVLVAAGLLLHTLRNLHKINPGFDARNVLLFGLDPTLAGYSNAQALQFYSTLQGQLRAVPGVTSASYSQTALLSGTYSSTSVHLDGAPPKVNVQVNSMSVSPGFFSTMRIPLLAGRDFTSVDLASAAAISGQQHPSSSPPRTGGAKPASPAKPRVASLAPMPAMINEAFARAYFAKQNPVGRHFGNAQGDQPDASPDPGYLILGVVGNAKYNDLQDEIRPTVYTLQDGGAAFFEVRTTADPAAATKVVRDVVAHLDASLPLIGVRTQLEQIEQGLALQHMLAQLSTAFGLLALVLACIGLYGLLAYEVVRRTREIGIRLALGAQRADVLRLVVKQGAILAFVGGIIGIAIALGVARLMASILFNVPIVDPATLIVTAFLLITVTLLACYVPAWRAMRVDPMIALRYE